MTAPLTIEQAASLRGRALALVEHARRFGAVEQYDAVGVVVVRASVTRGCWHVTGRARQVRQLGTEVDAVLATEELLVEELARETATYTEVAADVARGAR